MSLVEQQFSFSPSLLRLILLLPKPYPNAARHIPVHETNYAIATITPHSMPNHDLQRAKDKHGSPRCKSASKRPPYIQSKSPKCLSRIPRTRTASRDVLELELPLIHNLEFALGELQLLAHALF